MWRRGGYNAINGVKQHPGIIFMIFNDNIIIKRGFPGCLCVCPCLGLGLAEPWPLWDKVMEGEVTPPYFSLLDVDAPPRYAGTCWFQSKWPNVLAFWSG